MTIVIDSYYQVYHLYIGLQNLEIPLEPACAEKALYLNYSIQLALIAYPRESMVLFTVPPDLILIDGDESTCSTL